MLFTNTNVLQYIKQENKITSGFWMYIFTIWTSWACRAAKHCSCRWGYAQRNCVGCVVASRTANHNPTLCPTMSQFPRDLLRSRKYAERLVGEGTPEYISNKMVLRTRCNSRSLNQQVAVVVQLVRRCVASALNKWLLLCELLCVFWLWSRGSYLDSFHFASFFSARSFPSDQMSNE